MSENVHIGDFLFSKADKKKVAWARMMRGIEKEKVAMSSLLCMHIPQIVATTATIQCNIRSHIPCLVVNGV